MKMMIMMMTHYLQKLNQKVNKKNLKNRKKKEKNKKNQNLKRKRKIHRSKDLPKHFLKVKKKLLSKIKKNQQNMKSHVLTIKSFDYSEEYDEAWSLVDENFVYRRGQWVEVKDFNEDRWQDSTTGIHFWLTREEAKAY